MSPFNDLGRRGGPRPTGSGQNLPAEGPVPPAGAQGEESGISENLGAFARIVLLAALACAGLLTLGVRGVVLVQDYLFR